jgi:hypothetical protein
VCSDRGGHKESGDGFDTKIARSKVKTMKESG